MLAVCRIHGRSPWPSTAVKPHVDESKSHVHAATAGIADDANAARRTFARWRCVSRRRGAMIREREHCQWRRVGTCGVDRWWGHRRRTFARWRCVSRRRGAMIREREHCQWRRVGTCGVDRWWGHRRHSHARIKKEGTTPTCKQVLTEAHRRLAIAGRRRPQRRPGWESHVCQSGDMLLALLSGCDEGIALWWTPRTPNPPNRVPVAESVTSLLVAAATAVPARPATPAPRSPPALKYPHRANSSSARSQPRPPPPGRGPRPGGCPPQSHEFPTPPPPSPPRRPQWPPRRAPPTALAPMRENVAWRMLRTQQRIASRASPSVIAGPQS